MTIEEIKKLVNSREYDFLRTNEHLGSNIIMLGLGGSHAYGTNIETSDVDIRGCALNSKEDILGGTQFEQFINEETDTTVYSFNKLINLLSNCNPNVIEMLGLEDWQYLYLSPIGKELINRKDLFISKRCVHTFGGYANQQLYKLNQLSKHQMDDKKLEQHILSTLEHMRVDFTKDYATFDPADYLNLYIDKSEQENMETEIFMDVQLSHYPLRDYCSMWNNMQNTVRQYKQLGDRNRKALEHGKISKHMMHLVRLYHMCFEILENGEINTYRSKDHDELMEIRNGKFVDENNQIDPAFFEMVDELENKLNILKDKSTIPDKADMKSIMKFKMNVNEMIIKGDN